VEAKKEGRIEKVLVTGCLSERYKKELSAEIDNVDGFYGVNDLPLILQDLAADYKKELIGERHLTTPSHFAYLKISEGCDRSCSFCAIPLIRGKHISVPEDQLVNEARFLASKGVKELLLIAQDLTYYGIDIYGKRTIARLVEKLTAIDGIEWIRLHYAYPAGFPEELLQLMNDNPKVCKYLDIPLQHINDRILQSMKRGLGSKGTRNLVRTMKEKIPDVALRTTLIVGYPGETDKEFEELLQFIREVKFDRLGVFKYSAEEDTSAFNLNDDVPEDVKEERFNRIMSEQQEISLALNKQREGKTFKTIIDRKEGDYYIGRTQFDSPEVDNEVLIDSDEPLKTGTFYNVLIEKADFFDLYGKVTG
jgi:ribosomal protein S12 methylthiotransferase